MQYIELNSAHRNRTNDSNPFSFTVSPSQSGTRDKSNAFDPVSDGAPVITWCSSNFRADNNTASVTGTIVSASSDATKFIVRFTATQPQQENNYYRGAVLNNTTISELRRITDTKYLGIVSGGSEDIEFTVDRAYSDSYSVGDSVTITDPTTLGSAPFVFVPNSSTLNEFYSGYYIYNQTRGNGDIITRFDGETGMVTTSTVQATWAAGDCFNIRKELPIFVGSASTVSSSSSFTIAGTQNLDYIGYYIRLSPTTPNATAPFNEIRRISAYVSTTNTFTVSPPFSSLPASPINVEILRFSQDNYSPFNCNKTLFSQDLCYDMSLVDLIIPLQLLSNTGAGTIDQYTHILVELTGLGSKSVIHSNNPASSRAIFRAPIVDIRSKDFVRIKSEMVQRVKFKFHSTFTLTLKAPNGDVLEFTTPDTSSPFPPNEHQISAIFQVELPTLC